MGYNHSLFQRMHAWIELFAKREDLTFYTMSDDLAGPGLELTLGAPRDLAASFPEDARAFAASADRFMFSYREKEGGAASASGFLFLTLEACNEEAYLLLDGEQVDPSTMYLLDSDVLGTGFAAWYIRAESPFIVWDVETCARFSSLTEYLTEGARRAFAYNPCWQTRAGEAPLQRRSRPRTTPLPELRALLVQRGAEPTMADDLIEWLGADISLLLPA